MSKIWIESIQDTNNKFKYPSKLKWNPQKFFKNSSGIIFNKSEKAIFRVYGHSRTIIAKKKILNSTLLSISENFDEYHCEYTNIEEFAGTLFIYGQDIEVIESEFLREFFLSKANQIIKRNKNSKKAA